MLCTLGHQAACGSSWPGLATRGRDPGECSCRERLRPEAGARTGHAPPGPPRLSPVACRAGRRAAGGGGDVVLETQKRAFRQAVRPGGRWTTWASRLRGEGTAARRAWRRVYVRRIVLSDAAVAFVAAAAGFFIRFRPGSTPLTDTGPSLWIAVLLPVVWVLAMMVSRSYEQRFLWVGAEEFRRVAGAAVLLLAAVGTVSWAFKLEVARGFVVIALPLAMLLTLLERGAHRSWLRHRRLRGEFQETAVIAGHHRGVAALHEQM